MHNLKNLRKTQESNTMQFRENNPYKNRNLEYFVEDGRCENVKTNIKEQEDFLTDIKRNGTKNQDSLNDVRLYQLTMLEKLLESDCKNKSEYTQLIADINDIMKEKDTDDTDEIILREIDKVIAKLLKVRLSPSGSRPGSPSGSRPGSPYSSRPGSPSGGRKTRRRKSKSKRTRRKYRELPY